MKIFITGMTIAFVVSQGLRLQEKTMDVASSGRIHLPSPRLDGRMSVEQALHQRRSIREYKQDEPLTLEEVSQLLWAAQGVTSADGLRTAPSAGALFPLEVYVVAGNVRTLQPGFYHYQSREHAIVRLTEGDKRRELCGAALDQDQLRDAPAIIVFSAVYERTMKKYLDRGKQYVHFEIGHAAQNVFLQAEALGLGTVPVGAFNDEEVKRVLGLSEVPLYLMPVGRK